MAKFVPRQFNLSNDPYILGIDSSTQGVAWCIYYNAMPIDYGIVNLTKYKEMSDKFKYLHDNFNALNDYNIELMAIEKSIYIGNPQTSRVLSYVVGATMMLAIGYDINNIIDTEPMQWKAYLGYRNITGKFERIAKSILGAQHGRKFCQELRKSQTYNILKLNYPQFETESRDISDACGIALYAWHTFVSPVKIKIDDTIQFSNLEFEKYSIPFPK